MKYIIVIINEQYNNDNSTAVDKPKKRISNQNP